MTAVYFYAIIVIQLFIGINLLRLPSQHLERVIPTLSKTKKSTHLIFRLLGPAFQREFSSSPLLQDAPKAFIHGNPHLDNYVRTFHGSGMVDFDRSRIGPYCWDLIRLFSSFYLSAKSFPEPLHQKIYDYTIKGYKHTFSEPHILYSEPSFLHKLQPQEDQFTTNQYLSSQKKWAGKLEEFQVSVDEVEILEMLSLYLKSRKESKLLKFFFVAQAARCPGSLGKEHILILLKPKKQQERRDSILIDLKETYTEEDTTLFYSPEKHQGLRMIQASNLYAPNVEQRLGHFTHKDIHYWGREIPSFNAKLKSKLRRRELEELGYSIGAQLGRAHRNSVIGPPSDIKKHLRENTTKIIETAQEMSNMVIQIQKQLLQQYPSK